MNDRALYFVDVLACLLFCLTLALVGARFDRETSVPVDLPRLAADPEPGSELPGPSITLRAQGEELEIFLEDERVSLEELEARLRAAPPAAVGVRAETSALARVIAAAHAAGVRDIRLAYQLDRAEGDR